MIDLTRITPEQANRIECALMMLEGAVKEQIDGNQALADDPSLPQTTRNNLMGTAQWWKELHALIYGKDDRS